jgi:peptide/nickel transport system substrate-binding protein
VRLKPDLTWHDGKPLTAEDVVFTYRSIQNPDVQSPLNSSWLDVKVTAPDARTVAFELPNPLSAFPHSLTNGIVPQHLLRDVAAANMRSQRFNTVAPIGAGPFRMKTIEVSGTSPTTRQEEIALEPFEGYHAGAAKISSFIVRTFGSQEALLQAFRDQKINAMVDPQVVGEDITSDTIVQTHSMPLTAANMVFFKTTQGVLQDRAVRQALIAAADPAKYTAGLPKPVLPVRSPLLQSSPGYDPKYTQVFEGAEKAAAMLDAAGWLRQPDGPRKKGQQALTFKLYAQRSPENEGVLKALAEDWEKIGVQPQMVLQSVTDLNATVSGIGGAGGHSYDALLYGISLGVDPDVYAYWHSRQADIRSSRLNFSEYKSATADLALEAGRTRTEASLRAVKYQPFLQAWQADAPALGLYQPRFSYVTRGQVYGFDERTLTQATDRFNTVHDWMVRREPQPIK